MSLTHLFHDGLDAYENQTLSPASRSYLDKAADPAAARVQMMRQRVRLPDTSGAIERHRLQALLDHSRQNYPATLVTGRAGTGKTVAAAAFAAAHGGASWYSIESPDTDWPTFAAYFLTSIGFANTDEFFQETAAHGPAPEWDERVEKFLDSAFGPGRSKPTLIVLDDVHHLFDAEWFGSFFGLLPFSLPEGSHVLLLSRSRPSAPLWRMRSKQVLNVIDERLLAFTADEARALFRANGLAVKGAEEAQRRSYGRASKLVSLIRTTPFNS
jgi:ATP/maltotriose-dependent transcriptional regulator MalT